MIERLQRHVRLGSQAEVAVQSRTSAIPPESRHRCRRERENLEQQPVAVPDAISIPPYPPGPSACRRCAHFPKHYCKTQRAYSEFFPPPGGVVGYCSPAHNSACSRAAASAPRASARPSFRARCARATRCASSPTSSNCGRQPRSPIAASADCARSPSTSAAST